jgi:hypothetical protein
MKPEQEILLLKRRIKELEERAIEDSWRRSPDRSGGQFSDWEINRRGDEFS